VEVAPVPEQQAMVARMRKAIETMTDTTVRLTNYRKDGSSFINQSSLFVIFATKSTCAVERKATVRAPRTAAQ
jgi:hypothetical protein